MERRNGALEWSTGMDYWNGALERAVLLFLATNEYHFSSCSLLSGIFELYINFRVYICSYAPINVRPHHPPLGAVGALVGPWNK